MNPLRSCLARAAGLLGLSLAAACGAPSIDQPEGLALTTYPADQAFRLTLIMRGCADGCATYEAPECTTSVDEEDRVIDVDATVAYSRDDAAVCVSFCGPQVLAHCDVPALPAGTWRVRDGKFERQIDLR